MYIVDYLFGFLSKSCLFFFFLFFQITCPVFAYTNNNNFYTKVGTTLSSLSLLLLELILVVMMITILIKCHQTSTPTPRDCRSGKSPLLEATLLV